MKSNKQFRIGVIYHKFLILEILNYPYQHDLVQCIGLLWQLSPASRQFLKTCFSFLQNKLKQTGALQKEPYSIKCWDEEDKLYLLERVQLYESLSISLSIGTLYGN